MMVTWRAVRQVRASEEVAAQILRAFYDERLKPGEWLGTERGLAQRFNVSRVTIRDAVNGLAARGLLDVRVGAHTVACASRAATPRDSSTPSLSSCGCRGRRARTCR